MSKPAAGAIYMLLGILAAVIAAFGVELGNGNVPIPPDQAWLVPILSAAIVAVTAAIRKVTGED